MRQIIITTIIVFFALSCKHKDNEIGKVENYILTEKDIDKECNVYQMLFKEGDYIFRFSLAGKCKNLKKENYIREYSIYLEKYRNQLINRRGFIIFDKREFNKDNDSLCDSILAVSKNYFKARVFITENNKTSFTIKIVN